MEGWASSEALPQEPEALASADEQAWLSERQAHLRY